MVVLKREGLSSVFKIWGEETGRAQGPGLVRVLAKAQANEGL